MTHLHSKKISNDKADIKSKLITLSGNSKSNFDDGGLSVLMKFVMIMCILKQVDCVTASDNTKMSRIMEPFYYCGKLNNFIKLEHLSEKFNLIEMKLIRSNLFQKSYDVKIKGFLSKLIDINSQCNFQRMFCDSSSCSSQPCQNCVEKCIGGDNCDSVMNFFNLNTTNCNNKHLVTRRRVLNSNYQVIDDFN